MFCQIPLYRKGGRIGMGVGRAFEFFIQWHLTERCNLRCLHCYQQDSHVGELSFDQIKAVAAEVAETIEAWSQAYEIPFTLSYNLTGGEPFLRSDLFEILEHIISRKGDIFVLTNGTLITRDVARKIADSGVRGVQVSLEGPEEIHDGIRGKGSFTAALEGVRRLVSAGLPVTLNTTLSRMNAPYAADLAQIARDSGARRLGFARLVPAGRGGALSGEMLDSMSLKSLYSELLSMHIEGVEIVIGDPMASQTQRDEEGAAEETSSLAMAGCAAAVSGLTFLSDGTVVPCRRLPIPIGNIVSDDLREIWATSPVLNRLRDRNSYHGRCGKCQRWSICRGCRAIAYACSKSERDRFLDDDPQCFLQGGVKC
jgi:AdoMet-dependent heme synthase